MGGGTSAVWNSRRLTSGFQQKATRWAVPQRTATRLRPPHPRAGGTPLVSLKSKTAKHQSSQGQIPPRLFFQTRFASEGERDAESGPATSLGLASPSRAPASSLRPSWWTLLVFERDPAGPLEIKASTCRGRDQDRRERTGVVCAARDGV